jgi:aminopeptidase
MKNNGVINGLRRGESTTPIESELRNKAIDNIFEINLAVAKNERILVFADDYKPEIFAEAKYVAKRGIHYGRVDFFKYPNTGMNGTEPPISLWEIAFGKNIVEAIVDRKLMKKILDKTINDEELRMVQDLVREDKKDVVNVVIGLAWYSTTHTNFRKLLTGFAGVRYASMPVFDPKMWQTGMSANWEEVARRTLSLQDKLFGATSAHVRTPKGTDIVLALQSREFWADTGLLNQSGSYGNLPAGELAIAPLEEKSNGKLVIEPIEGVQGQAVLEVRNGSITKVKGDTGYVSWMEASFQKHPLARNIAEFGIGTNEEARIGTTMLELEKILGTIHIALGDNTSFGGKILVPFHTDILFENPTVEVTLSTGRTLKVIQDAKILW